MDPKKKRKRGPPEAGKDKSKCVADVETTQESAEKRRKQNRISQREHRQKQQAYMRTMESFIDAVKVNSEADDEQSRYSRLLKAHTDLMEENRRLRDNLTSIRRRLLNLADQVVCSPERSPSPSARSEHAPTPPEIAASATPPPEIGTTFESFPAPTEQSNDYRPSSEPIEGRPPNYFEDLINMNFDLEPDITAVVQNVLRPSHCALPAVSHSSPMEEFGTLEIASHDLSYKSLTSTTPLVQQPYPPLPMADRPKAIDSAANFAQHVIKAARRFTVHLDRWLVDGLVGATERESLITKVASTAVQVLAARAGLGTYIYPTVSGFPATFLSNSNGDYPLQMFAVYLEYIMRWRISQCRNDLLAIPEPFRPTQLQCSDSSYPVVIDFINWPSIRDQLVRHVRYLDLDAMCREIVLNTVVELPEFGIAVNIHDLLFDHLLPQIEGVKMLNGKQSMLHDPSWIYLQVDPPKSTSVESDDTKSIEDVLFKEIAGWLSAREDPQLDSAVTFASGASQSLQGLSQLGERSLTTALSSFRVFDVTHWKLSREFASKHPYMDCASVMSRFEMVACDSEQFRCVLSTVG
ncbi:hypothetical protein BKA63DRAFT_582712 [Paraphoma chrysanthemicola]|nr:hypothetical protein BKA63DRAFT_582712 [Paraphoma chrysanthemicola]